MQDVYKQTHGRTTNEIENDEDTINTKRVSLWGYDGVNKVKIKVDASGNLVTNQLTVPLEQTEISVNGDASAASAGTTTGKSWMMLQNGGTADIFFGSSAATTANAPICYPSQNYVFDGCASDFKVYFCTYEGSAGTAKVIER